MRRNLLFGKRIRLVKKYLTTGTEHAELVGDTVIVYLYPSVIERKVRELVLQQFFEAQLQHYITERMKYYCELYNEHNVQFYLTNKMRSIAVGICQPQTRTIKYKPKLIHSPKESIDAVIIHELCHLQVLEHNKDFWNLVYERMPDYDKWFKMIIV